MTEMNACFRLASRYRRATWSSKGRSKLTLFFSSTGTESRLGSMGYCQEHHEPIDADAFAAGRRQAVLERPDVTSSIACASRSPRARSWSCASNPPPLLGRVVELAEGVRDLEAADVQLEPLHCIGIIRLHLPSRSAEERLIQPTFVYDFDRGVAALEAEAG